MGQAEIRSSPPGAVLVPSAISGGEIVRALAGTRGEARLAVIRRAASAPLAPFGPAPGSALRWGARGSPGSVGAAIGEGALGRVALGLSFYARGALSVTVVAPPGGDRVQVSVRYLFHCAVPVAARLLCREGAHWLPGGGGGLSGVESPPTERWLAASGERFLALGADAAWVRQRPLWGLEP